MPTSTRTDVVAIPVLTGSLLRLPLGLWRDRVGARGVPVGFFCFSSYRCSWVGGFGSGVGTVYLLGATRGVAGASIGGRSPADGIRGSGSVWS